MATRFRILLSAYACAPHRGSEHEVGWQWAIHMARFHDVTVLTRTKHREAIERGLAELPAGQPKPTFVYHEAAPWLLAIHRRLKITRTYYIAWQRSAQGLLARLHTERRFDLMHHVAFAGFRYRTAIWHHQVPTVWGPIGGMESIPAPLLPWGHPSELAMELLRNAGNLLMGMGFHVLYYRAALSSVILASNRETQHAFAELGISVELLPTIGLDPAEVPESQPPSSQPGRLKLLFVGKVVLLKGIDLALEALAAADSNSTLTVVGQGPFLGRAKKLAARLGLKDRVDFRGAVPRKEIWGIYADHDALLLPTLHDSGSFTVLEALASQRPVICLDCGGPAISVESGCGRKVPLGDRKSVVGGLVQAIRDYAQNRGKLQEDGKRGKASVFARYAWAQKAATMNLFYEKAMLLPARGASRFRQRNVLVAMVLLLSISTASFLSLGQLKEKSRLVADQEVAALSAIGLATASMNQSLLAVSQGLASSQPREMRQFLLQADGFSRATFEHLQEYQKIIEFRDSRGLFPVLMSKRDDYLNLRAEIQQLAFSGQVEKARALAKERLFKSFEGYKAIADQLLSENIASAKALSRSAEATASWAQILVALSSALLLAIGFILGFFK